MAIEKEQTTFSFVCSAEGIQFTFNIPEETKEKAILKLRSSLAVIIADINEQLNDIK